MTQHGSEETIFSGANALYLEQQYALYRRDARLVAEHWRAFFDNLGDTSPPVHPSWQRADWPPLENGELTAALDGNWREAQDDALHDELMTKLHARSDMDTASERDIRDATLDSIRAIMMIRAYRFRGHLAANLDPLELESSTLHPELDPASYGFTPADYDRPIFIDNVLGLESATIHEMLDILRRTYCGTFAVEFMHISDREEKAWLQERMEGADKEITFTDDGKRAIFQKLVESEGLEKFLAVKYTGTKRFGLDGGEALVPALEQIIKRGGNLGVREIVIGMPHRGRLNVLANVMAKPFRALFHEFKGGNTLPDMVEGSGDVKYHLGASAERVFDNNRVHLSLSANPSHLEAVDPIVLGKARAKQDQYHDKSHDLPDRSTVIPLLLHGDAAFAGQGIVAECLGLSGLKGHKSGGSIHFIVNNQIGFTTNPRFSRSSPYPSDVAKMVEAPIFHVNGDDPEAVVHAAKIATEFRQKFLKPVIIDMFCYRRFGHNESDEPSFTQPHMYARIRAHDSVVKTYGARLVAEGVISQHERDSIIGDYRALLEEEFAYANDFTPTHADWLDGRWMGLERKADDKFIRGKTGVARKTLADIGWQLTDVPPDFNAHKTLARQLAAKRKIFENGGDDIDWATAEALAFGSILLDGYGVRLSGQDSERGTFSQRHCVWIDQKTEAHHRPLNALAESQAHFEVVNSMLSEVAVLGFEYGYSLAEPNMLVLWEAQFGDFANGAQVIIDQFISSGEHKWLRMSGLVMLLPHGYEGQGPEHSSARLERYLQLCAEDNIQVANCTTPANYFHILRRQLQRNFRKPLILMTPKSLLRHKACKSTLEDMDSGTSFHRILPDSSPALKPPRQCRRLILCSGKVYYDLAEARMTAGIDDVYILRIEQLYPVPKSVLKKYIAEFAHAEFIWCQEEPHNMGAWSFIAPHIEEQMAALNVPQSRLVYVGRCASASTAAGTMSRHMRERDQLLKNALSEPLEIIK